MRKVLHFLFSAESLWGKLACIVTYLLIYDFLFENFVFKTFAYLGDIDYIPMDTIHRILWLVCSTLPFCFYRGIHKVSSFLTLFLYLFAYIPIVHAISVIWDISAIEKQSVNIILCIFFCLYFFLDSQGNIIKDFRIVPAISFRWIEILTIALTVLFVAVQLKNMHFVNPISQQDLLYDFREKNAEGSSGPINYISGWLFGAFYPFLLVNFLKERNWLKAISILGGYFLLFMADMQKITFFMPFFLVGMYFLIKANIKSITQYLHAWITMTICIVSPILLGLQDHKTLFIIVSFVILRTVCVSGWLTQMYVHFFQFHPFTYYSHIGIVNFFTQAYPYDVPLGKAIAYNTQNANATFFLTDGYAAWGFIGIVAIGLFFLLFLSVINAIGYRYKVSDLMIVLLPCLSYLLNTSIFTTLLTNGMILTILLLCCTDNALAVDKTIDIKV
ncbi:hypothetical protein Premu_1760 [Hallella multisaccharivorax DSM 17128]|uniref:Uncharacterized protein n=1 Tax=Hallella multisaccharivorax DSM 17128 TaxID=688246 RepID=F8N5Y1_9BACT|nr:hypothetical protein [Hallella multisaccharivorax]EGN57165.1 hypothetical protein Premu_1760 [Hallella multisaccharivorax DSM 17128]